MSLTPCIDVEPAVKIKRLVSVRRFVAQFDAGLQSPEQIGREDDVAFLGEEVGGGADDGIDADVC